jgi:mono/diheme cytochrome c family protein
MTNFKIFTVTVAATFIGLSAAQAGDAEKGKATFMKKGCYECHGFEGQGGSAGLRLSNTQLPEDGLIAFVRGTSGAMPPFSSKIVTDAELSDIYAYLQSRPKPADPKTIPLLAN